MLSGYTRAFFGLVIVAFLRVAVEGAWECNSCDVQIKIVGCFNDKDKPHRALPDEILNERDPTSSVYGGQPINWHDWNNWMEKFACRCAHVAIKKGYHHFGLQYYGECWAKKGATKADYAKYGLSKKCISDDYKQCDKYSRECVGEHWTNVVYEIVPSECNLKFERIGCFKDKHTKNARPLPHYLLNDRDSSASSHSGQTIDWRNWDVYMPEFACRCAQAAKKKGHTTFGLQFYGECWSGSRAQYTYYKDGESSDCIDKCFKPCKKYEKFCHGKNYANAVYRLVDAACEYRTTPLGCYGESAAQRALDVELVNERDPRSIHFQGDNLNKGNWKQEFPHLLCTCARVAKQQGMTNFGVDNKGVCWGSRNPDAYTTHGISTKCTKGKTPCSSAGSANCVDAIFAYKITTSRKRTFQDMELREFDDQDSRDMALESELLTDITTSEDTTMAVDDLLDNI